MQRICDSLEMGSADRQWAERIRDEVQAIRRGAFVPFHQNPAVTAALLPFGSLGTLTAMDFFSKLG